jgi:hypothetical protein
MLTSTQTTRSAHRRADAGRDRRPAAPAAPNHRVFLLTVPLMALALVLALVMREKPLSVEIAEIAEGKAEAPEY